MPTEEQLEKLRRAILEKRFGDVFFWERPTIEKTVGPFDPSVFEIFEIKRDTIVSEAEHKLLDFTPDELFLLFDTALDDPANKRIEWLEFNESEIKTLKRWQPSWIEGGFGHPEYSADFDYWGKMEKFTLHESLMLSVGIEPKHFSEKRLSDAAETMKSKSLIAPVEYLVKRREQFDRKWPFGSYERPRVSPTFLFDWFTEISLDVHNSFLDALRQRLKFEDQERQALGEPVLPKTDRREIDKIAQLFTAMAIDNLGYNPHDLRGPIPKEIADLAAGMGLSVSDETVRKYLRLGAKFLPKDWEPK